VAAFVLIAILLGLTNWATAYQRQYPQVKIAVLMAAGCVWGLSQRLAEYR
jgi:hypothetical protein